MCGRVTETQPERIVEAFEIAVEPPDLGPPRYNVSPSEAVPDVRLMDLQQGRRLDLLHWGSCRRGRRTRASGAGAASAC